MRSSKFSKEDSSEKKKKSAATNFSSSSSIAPPAFSPTSQNESSSSSTDLSSLDPSSRTSESSSTEDKKLPVPPPEQSNAPEDVMSSESTTEESSITSVDPNHVYNAMVEAHQLFKTTSRFNHVQILGPIAMGASGCLNGIRLKSYMQGILASYKTNNIDSAFVDATVNTISELFEQWKDSVQITALPWYPAFAFYPGPVAPPTPNVPTPLRALNFQEYLLTNKGFMIQKIKSKLPEEYQNESNLAKIESLSDLVTGYFDLWFLTTIISGAMAHGSVPSFAPPFVPGGPVMGSVLPTPGVL